MIDYHTGCVALGEFTAALAGESFPDKAQGEARDLHLAAVEAEGGRALLGAFVHHLLGHAAGDGSELDLIERAGGLWSSGVGLCNELQIIRTDLETSLDDPSDPNAADNFNVAAWRAQALAQSANRMRASIDALRTDVLEFRHLPRHPRQEDRATGSWDWGNLPLARRTEAFVRSLFERAADPGAMAFAVGACASYGAKVAGSAFLGHTVGGPRRNHRHRDRLARNAVGDWIATHHPAAVPPAAMASRITLDPSGKAILPPDVESLVRDALADTFDLGRGRPPDLQLGYRRLVEHLTSLDGFTPPYPPAPPSGSWVSKVLSDPSKPPPSLRPEGHDITGRDAGGAAVPYGGPPARGSSTPSESDSSDVAKACGVLVAIVLLNGVAQAFVQCIRQWETGSVCTYWQEMLAKKLWDEDPPADPTDPEHPGVTGAALSTIAESPQVPELLWLLFEVHCQIWEAIDRARAFLAVAGLTYPGTLATNPLYAQFVTLRAPGRYPHREEADPTRVYHLYPTSAIEQPTTTPSPFPSEARPDVFLGRAGGHGAADVTLRLWGEIASGAAGTQNLDLDADRGFAHPCWTASGSVHDDPVDVVSLEYDAQ